MKGSPLRANNELVMVARTIYLPELAASQNMKNY